MKFENSASEEWRDEGEMTDPAAAEVEEGASEESGTEHPRSEADGELQRELEVSRERYLRLAAEYDNFRKRTDRERLEVRDRAQANLVAGLLDALDDLQRVGDFSPENTTVDALLEGVQLVETKFFKALEAAGLEPLESQGKPFDPELHEALMVAPTEDPEEDDTVGMVFQTGYTFRGALLRPARVQVRKLDG